MTVPRTLAMDVEGLATTFANVPTIELSQRRPKDCHVTKVATFVPGSEISEETPPSGDVQWQDETVDKVLDHILVTLYGLKLTPTAV